MHHHYVFAVVLADFQLQRIDLIRLLLDRLADHATGNVITSYSIHYTKLYESPRLLAEQSRQIADRLQALEVEAHELAGQAFNLSSTKQLGEILFDKLGLPVLKKTPKGAPSTAEEVLQELALDYPLPRLLLEHRSLAKLKSTYTDKLPQMSYNFV